jgi:hypothetical protein
MKYFAWLPPDGAHILLVLFLSFLIGLEREERKASDDHVAFGGVRTFPLIGLIGYSMAVLSGGELLPQALGFAVVAGFLLMSYWHKLASSGDSGVTSEMSGLVTYLVGALVYREMFWIATTLTVSSILLLELKAGLENLTKRIETTDILTFAKFLLLLAVILPLRLLYCRWRHPGSWLPRPVTMPSKEFMRSLCLPVKRAYRAFVSCWVWLYLV